MARTIGKTPPARLDPRKPPPAATGRSRASQPRGPAPKPPTPNRLATHGTSPRKVRAIRMGYYNEIRRRDGDVFVLQHPAREFSTQWMEYVDARTPERVTTGSQELKKKHDEILGGKVAEREPDNTGDEHVLGE